MALLESWQEAGIDVAELFASMQRERDELARDLPKVRRLGPVQGFVIPTLRRCGLLSERVATRFHEFLQGNLGSRIVGEDVHEFLRRVPDLPEDTAAWVLGDLPERAQLPAHGSDVAARQLDDEDGAGRGRAPFERSAVRLDQLAGEHEAEADAVGLGGGERREEPVADLGRDARTRGRGRDAHHAVVDARVSTSTRMPGSRRLDGVVEQVADRLLHLVLVERHDHVRRVAATHELGPPRGGRRGAHSADALLDQLAQRVRVEVQRAVLPEAEQLLDDAVGLVDARRGCAPRARARRLASAPRPSRCAYMPMAPWWRDT